MSGDDRTSVARRVAVYGMVQGVYFRYNTRNVAVRLGLSGWVRNRADGSVEALFQGPQERVDAAVDWCRRGPQTARVDRIEAEATEPDARLTGFGIR
jgi:acylphosphatase